VLGYLTSIERADIASRRFCQACLDGRGDVPVVFSKRHYLRDRCRSTLACATKSSLAESLRRMQANVMNLVIRRGG
jgi:hypothetical protein